MQSTINTSISFVGYAALLKTQPLLPFFSISSYSSSAMLSKCNGFGLSHKTGLCQAIVL